MSSSQQTMLMTKNSAIENGPPNAHESIILLNTPAMPMTSVKHKSAGFFMSGVLAWHGAVQGAQP